MAEQVKIDLKEPVKVDGKEVSSLTMRSARVRDLLAAEKAGSGDAEREVYLIALLCGVAPEAIEDLLLSDYKKLQDKSKGFLS